LGESFLPLEGLVDILFKTHDLRNLCSRDKIARKKLGPKGARKLQARLADLMAADNMAAVVFGRPHQLSGKLAGCMAMDLDGGRRIVVEAAHDPTPTKDDGGVDWSRVDVVRVVLVGDYHD
jgi:toxin HigB-1